jgi:hypothetical protein
MVRRGIATGNAARMAAQHQQSTLKVIGAQQKLVWSTMAQRSTVVRSTSAMGRFAVQGSNWTALLGSMKTGLAAGVSGLGSLASGALAAAGPILALAAVTAAAVYSVSRTKKVWDEMRQAQQGERASKASARRQEAQAQQGGYVTYESTAKAMGYTDEQIKKGLSEAEEQRVRATMMQRARQNAGKRRRAGTSAAAQGERAQQQAQANQYHAQVAAQVAARDGSAATRGMQAPARSSRSGGDGKPVTINFYANSNEDMRRQVLRALDDQFGVAPA